MLLLVYMDLIKDPVESSFLICDYSLYHTHNSHKLSRSLLSIGNASTPYSVSLISSRPSIATPPTYHYQT
jgi:hypothetical protein